MITTSCRSKHTLYQPPQGDWRCPNFDATVGDFTIECSPLDAADDCTLLHTADDIFCANCQKAWCGSKVAALMKRKAGVEIVKCEACSGLGHTQRPKVKAATRAARGKK